MNLKKITHSIKFFINITMIMMSIFLSTNVLASDEKNDEPKHTSEDFKIWVAKFREKILSGGYKISAQTFDNAFQDVKFNEKVISKDRNQAEFAETFWSYYNNRLTKSRIENGRIQYANHKKLLSEIEKKYGVPGNYIVAFWGMETNYGQYFGGWNIIEALALLTYEGRRQTMFERELITALQILEGNHISNNKMRGSWAGAMGNFQFMPSTYFKYAVDGDGDGRIDIWESIPDAFHSAGNYLKKIGWESGRRWGREVLIPDDFNWMLIGDEDATKTTTRWKKLGIKKANGDSLDESDVTGYLFAPQGKHGPIFLVYKNFDIIMKWNVAYNYAINIGLLSDAIINQNAKLYATEINEPLLKNNIIEIQKELYDLGFYKYEDFRGILNNRTRNAIRKYQKEYGLTPDGYPSNETYLHILNKGSIK